MKMNSLKKTAFTLAEVLITLGIIGVVAALTIPTLVANYQKTQYVTGLKKTYVTVVAALSQYVTDQNCDGLQCTGSITDSPGVGSADVKLFGDSIAPYFKILKRCGVSVNQNCFAVVNVNYDGSGSTLNYDATNFAYKFITVDGMAYSFNLTGNCTARTSSINNPSFGGACADLYIDVNGPGMPPNYMGRDVFLFYVTDFGSHLVPYGMKGTINYNVFDCYNATKYGNKCAGRIMQEGWQMNY